MLDARAFVSSYRALNVSWSVCVCLYTATRRITYLHHHHYGGLFVILLDLFHVEIGRLVAANTLYQDCMFCFPDIRQRTMIATKEVLFRCDVILHQVNGTRLCIEWCILTDNQLAGVMLWILAVIKRLL